MRTVRNELISIRYVLTALSLLALAQVRPARAFNYVTDATGTWWGIQDAAPPRVDTGSIRATQPARAIAIQQLCHSALQHLDQRFAGIKVLVQTTPSRG